MTTLDNPEATGAEPSIWPTVLRYSVIGSLIFIVYSLLGNVTGFTRPTGGMGMLALNFLISLGLYIGIIVAAVRHYRDQEAGGFVAFGKAFQVGLGVIVIIGIITALFTLLYITVIDPGYLASMSDDMREMFERMGMNEEQIEAGMERMENMTPLSMMRQSIIGTLIFGGISSAIVAAIMKRTRDAF